VTDSGHQLVLTILIDSEGFFCGTSSISYLIKLFFHPYVDRQEQSPYTTWTSILARGASRVRDRLEFDIDWASNLAWMPLLVFLDGGQGGGSPRASLVCYPSHWSMLRLGPRSQG
jgi:hypothetical protein